MAYVLIDSDSTDNNNYLLYIVIFLFSYFIFSKIFKKSNLNEMFNLIKMSDTQQNVCSKKCCFTGWNSSVQIEDENVSDADLMNKFSTSNLNCSNGIDNVGCVCIPK
jgi:hypothetical protein